MELRRRDESTTKEFVSVLAVHWPDGKIEPLRFQREDGTVVILSKILLVKRAASFRAGGQGIRYTCRIVDGDSGRLSELYLFHDGDYWFVEISEGEGEILCADGTTLR